MPYMDPMGTRKNPDPSRFLVGRRIDVESPRIRLGLCLVNPFLRTCRDS